MKYYSECHKYFCEVHVFMKSGAAELEFRRTCKTKRAAKELAEWIHKQYSEGASTDILTLEMPCESRNQAPRTLSFRARDICAITTVVSTYDTCEDDYKIEPGFRVTSEAPDSVDTSKGDEDLVAKRGK